MKMRMLMGMLVGALSLHVVAGEVAVTSVTARQRYPWNGLVDIAVTLQGSAEDVLVTGCAFAATNSATKAEIPVEHITRNGDDSGSGNTWTRKFIWDAKADIGAVKIDDVALTVDAKIPCVQLWENGPYWAECNVGATKPEECGYYFWWGDTVGYKRNASNNGWISVKDSTSFSFSSGNCPTYGKNNSQLQSEGCTDATGNLVAAHDAATAHLGAPWRMPTDAEFSALINNCDTEWTSRNGVSGRLVKGRGSYASKSIFLPAAGYGYDSYLYDLGSNGYYWSSTPNSGSSNHAWRLDFRSGNFCQGSFHRRSGQSVRPVRGFADAGITADAVMAHLALDCREGTREISAGGEELRYDVGWYADADQIRILDDGAVVETGAIGSVLWYPESDKSSSHALVLEVLRNGQVVVTETAEFALGYIRNVTARQLWPHKKVEVCYEIADDIGEVADENAALVLTCGEGTVAPELTSSYPWTTDPETHKGSAPSYKSGGYNVNNAKSTMCCTVSGATQVSFYWKVSSESNYDKLKFYVDETEKTTAISGNVDWTLVTVDISSSSNHTLKWSYEKDGSVDSGSDCGWVDCIDVKYASTAVAAKTVLGDTRCTPGHHRVVWDMEADGVAVNQPDAKFVVGYGVGDSAMVPLVEHDNGEVIDEAKGVSAPTEINTSSSVKDGMAVAGTMRLGYSPIDARAVELQVDGATLLSAVESGEFVWTPLTLGSHTLKHIAGSNVWTRVVNVTELDFVPEAVPNPPGPVDETVSLGTYEKVLTSANKGVGTFAVTSTTGTGTWTASASDGWISLSKASGAIGADKVAYVVDANPNAGTRTGYVYVNGHVHTIVQPGKGATLSSETLVAGPDGLVQELDITAAEGVEWNARPESSWVSVQPTSGIGSGKVTVRVAPFCGTEVRNGTVMIAGRTVSVAQRGREVWLGCAEMNCTDVAQTLMVDVFAISDASWSVVSGAAWISVQDAGTGLGDSTVTLSVGRNESYLPRTGTVAIGTETLTVIQEGCTSLSLSIGESATTVVAGETKDKMLQITATPDMPWTVTSDCDWLMPDDRFASGSGTATIVYSVSANPALNSRTGHLTIVPPKGSGLVAKTLTVMQSAAASSLSETGKEISSLSETVSVNVTVDEIVQWSIACKVDWVTVDGADNCTGSQTVKLKVAANPTTIAREGVVTIAGHDYTIRQAGETVSVESDVLTYGSDMDLGTFDVTASDYLTWETSTDEDWLFLTSSESTTGSGYVEYIVDELTDASSRIGIIWVGNRPIYICQCAVETTLEATSGEVPRLAGSGQVSVGVCSGETWCALSTVPWISLVKTSGGNGESLQYVFEANMTGAVRTGRILVNDKVFTLTQLDIDPSAQSWGIVYENLMGATNPNPSQYYEGYETVFLPLGNIANFTFAGWTPASIPVGSTGDKVVTANWTWVPQGASVEASITGGKELKIEAAWVTTELEQRFGAGKAEDFRAKYGADLSEALMKKTGKVDGAGNELSVWHDYVAGTDPTDPDSVFRAKLTMVNGLPVIEWDPNLNVNGENRVYTVYGKEDLKDAWHSPKTDADRFFKVDVAMPEDGTVTFNVGGGSSVDPIVIRVGKPIGVLPTPTRQGYDFLGWFTEEKGGTAVTPETIVTADMTIYAHWEKKVAADLVHRWSFNGDLTDSVGGQTATTVGNVTTDGSQYKTPGGSSGSAYIDLGNWILPTNGLPVTIEMWVTQDASVSYGRIFCWGAMPTEGTFSPYDTTKYAIDPLQMRWDGACAAAPEISLNSFAVGTEYHVAAVLEPTAGGAWRVTYYKQNASTGVTLSSGSGTMKSGWTLQSLKQTDMVLGQTLTTWDSCSKNSYNELRIWNKAMTEAELTASAKAGPDAEL